MEEQMTLARRVGAAKGLNPRERLALIDDLHDRICELEADIGFLSSLIEQKPNTWTVLLLRPDYIADTYGQDTMLLHVTAVTVDSAIEQAQLEAVKRDSPDDGDDPEAYYPLLCIRGRHEDLKP